MYDEAKQNEIDAISREIQAAYDSGHAAGYREAYQLGMTLMGSHDREEGRAEPRYISDPDYMMGWNNPKV